MREFFQGWRRKAGAVILVTACVLLTAWVNSFFAEHVFNCVICECGFRVRSEFGRLGWSLNWPSDGSDILEDFRFQWSSLELGVDDPAGLYPYGFGFSRGHAGKYPCDYLKTVIPYWSLVLPLTLLSAWLLLSKPRKTK